MNALSFATGIFLVTAGLTNVAAEISTPPTDQSQAVELINNAATKLDIRSAGSQTFHLRWQAHAQRITLSPLEGTVDEIWLAPDKWRREVIFPGFTQVETGDSDSKWVRRNADFRPSIAYWIAIALDAPNQIKLRTKEVVHSRKNQKHHGVQLNCVELQSASPTRTVCFDASGYLLSETLGTQEIAYSDYKNLGDKVFPARIEVHQFGEKVLSLSAEQLAMPSNPVPDLFSHDPTAQKMARCEPPLGEAPLNKVTPHYPEEARRAFKQGTVILFTLIGADGQVQKLRLVQGVTPSLDKAAEEAVRQWVFAPVQCGVPPLPSEREVDVNYSLVYH